MRPLLSLNRYLLRYKWYVLLGALFIAISNIFAILPAQIVRYAFDLVEQTINLYFLSDGLAFQKEVYDTFSTNLVVYGVLILAMALLRGVFLFLMRQTIIVMSRLIEYDQKNDIYAHYQTLSTTFYRRSNTGDLMARISEDVSRVRMYTGPAIMYGLNLVLLFVMVIGYMVSVSPTLTMWTLLPLPFLSVMIYYVNDLIAKRSERIQSQLSTLSTFVQEAFSGIRVIKAFHKEEDFSRQFTEGSAEYRQRSLDLARVNAWFFPVMVLMIGLSTLITVYVGGLEVKAGNITTGVIAEFIIYVNMLTWPVTSLGWITSIAQRASVSQTRINEFLNETSELVSRANTGGKIKGQIRFENVSFRYHDGTVNVLDGVDFSVEPGQSLAVLGSTGSGKSTLVSLVGRLFDVTGGKVMVDGRDIRDYDLHVLRSQMAFVPQDVFLFSDSIASNIAFGNPTINRQQVEQAAKEAELYDNVKSFEKGFDTVVGERGITLSGGQKQRTSIARALVLNPTVLVLDDCLSAVDTHTENAILNNLERLMQGRTTIIVSHRISSAKLADKIIVLEDGRVAESGTHAELLGANGLYAEMYDRQLAGEEV